MNSLLSRIPLIALCLIAIFFNSCEKDFEAINTDPTSTTDLDPQFLFTSTLLRTSGDQFEQLWAHHQYLSCFIQHQSALTEDWPGDKYLLDQSKMAAPFNNSYGEQMKLITDIIHRLEENPDEINLSAAARIWRVLIFQRLTDLYGDIPYFEAGKGQIENILFPSYDPQSAIYLDLLTSLEIAISDFDNNKKAIGSADFIYKGDVGKWKKFGYSLMLRIAMRLSKIDPTTAAQWAEKAINGGVIENYTESLIIPHSEGPEVINQNGLFLAHNSSQDKGRLSASLVNWLKENNDPRLEVIASESPDTNTIIGLPNGWETDSLIRPNGDTLKLEIFSRINPSLLSVDAPMLMLMHSEVAFLKAEAIERGWVSGSAITAYEEGVRSSMNQWSLFRNSLPIEEDSIANYLSNHPYNPSNFEEAMNLIHSQYWVSTFMNWHESYANWRRTGYPILTPINYQGNYSNGAIPRRFYYPQAEYSANTEAIDIAIQRQGPDNFTTRIWWDKE